MTLELFPFQVDGRDFMESRPFAYLAAEMGLGKTPTFISAAQRREWVHGDQNILVVCPATVRFHWQGQLEKFWDDKTVHLILESDQRPRQGAVNICSFNYAVTHADMLAKIEWDVLGVDEGHYLKGPESQRTQSVLGSGCMTGGIVGNAQTVWFLSGTPAPNHAAELWPWLRRFGLTGLSYWSFVRRYCTTRETPWDTKIVGTNMHPERVAELKQMIRPCLLRQRRKDVELELPPLFITELAVEPRPDETTLAHGKTDRGKKEKTSLIALAEIVCDASLRDNDDALLSAINAHPHAGVARAVLGSLKAPACAEIVRDWLKSKQITKVVLFCKHRAVIDYLTHALKEFHAAPIYGGQRPLYRHKVINRFQNNPYNRVMVVQIDAGGIGIELTAANTVVFVESDWVPAVNAQALMRVHRYGQLHPVTVHIARAAGTIDDAISRVVARKTREVAMFLDA